MTPGWRHKDTALERMEKNTIPEPNSGCLLWTGAFSKYGLLCFRGKRHRAHRFAWELVHGPIPEGMFVCHKCDNTHCVNVDHLFLGTAADNMQDKVQKGRHRFRAGPLTEESKAKIRAYWAQQRDAGNFKTQRPYAHRAKRLWARA